jgi:phosphomannomutase
LKPGQKERAIKQFSNRKLAKWLEWRITKQEDMDGVKLTFGDAGWLLVRASGTEPMLRLYAETPRAETTRRILDEATKIVKAI